MRRKIGNVLIKIEMNPFCHGGFSWNWGLFITRRIFMKQELICIELRNFIAVYFEASIFFQEFSRKWCNCSGLLAPWNLSENDAIIRSVGIAPIKWSPLLFYKKKFNHREHISPYTLSLGNYSSISLAILLVYSLESFRKWCNDTQRSFCTQ